jgi:hypothetical protein
MCMVACAAAMLQNILENVRRSLAPGGCVLLLVPAAESVALTAERQPEWLRRCELSGAAVVPIPASELLEQPECGSSSSR